MTPLPVPGPAARKSREFRRRQLLDVSALLFHQRGYDATTMNDVAEAAGLSKGTLYYHFDAKADLLQDVYEESVDYLLDRISRHPAGASPPELIELLITDTLDLIVEHPHHVTVFHQEADRLHEILPAAGAKQIDRKIRRYRDYIRTVIRAGIESGEFEDVDESMAAWALLGMASWTYQWFRPGGSRSRKEVAQVFTRIFLDGVRGPA